jgi:hypothetical protein
VDHRLDGPVGLGDRGLVRFRLDLQVVRTEVARRQAVGLVAQRERQREVGVEVGAGQRTVLRRRG